MKPETKVEFAVAAQRLCSEIQLFDLCDLEGCHFRKGRFCSNEDLVSKFESIKEGDDSPELIYDEDDFEDGDEPDLKEYDGDYEGYDDLDRTE